MGSNNSNKSKDNSKQSSNSSVKPSSNVDVTKPEIGIEVNGPGNTGVGVSHNPATGETTANASIDTPSVDVSVGISHSDDGVTVSGQVGAGVGAGAPDVVSANAGVNANASINQQSQTNLDAGTTTTTTTINAGVDATAGVTAGNNTVGGTAELIDATLTTESTINTETGELLSTETDLEVDSDLIPEFPPLDEESQAVLDGLTGDDEQFVETLEEGLGVGDNIAGEGNPLFDDGVVLPSIEAESGILSNWDAGDTQAAVNLGLSVYGLYNAIDGGNGLAIASAGINTIVSVNGLLDNLDGVAGDGLGGFMDAELGQTLGGITAGIGLVMALDAGDTVGAVASGLQLLSSLGVIDSVPGLGATIGVLNGDPMGAMTSMVALIPGWGWAAAAVLSIFGGSLMGDPPDPSAHLDFNRNEDGEIDFSTGSNETGGGLEAMLESSGSGFVKYLGALEEGYSSVLPGGQMDVSALPRVDLHQEYGHDEVEWRMAA